MNKYYQVYGNMLAEKSSEVYPYIPLCEECVQEHEVVLEGEDTNDECFDCGSNGKNDN
ncbi:hypothetical protein ACTMLF_17960 (plasmid) [Proteus mirabilis]|uniref:Uncharacterized protein n=1 Tax=Moellerella wisconsensis TaxID=158849 RepID=A0A9Q8Q589_9GAMM|nr:MULTISPECIES: hypothetical protein [Morganellaceae]MCT0097439.1 hypothetical protein [Proteus mirabilis]UNH32680.1 hypothetical protein MNY72_17520 [Moellerella wisconsensis]HBC8686382.1 hypothetical protein [Proteus mirabilis]HEK3268803.1 hypothetical protein [Proteus mirabilis]